ncbi:hypothetical protein Dip510_002133 [Elusimicrobium posterum]|uniref:hypothetical protein n=1 Tax=Elusimicrobium posterum TaxID=3116653 RepID=UPI003C70978C
MKIYKFLSFLFFINACVFSFAQSSVYKQIQSARVTLEVNTYGGEEINYINNKFAQDAFLDGVLIADNWLITSNKMPDGRYNPSKKLFGQKHNFLTSLNISSNGQSARLTFKEEALQCEKEQKKQLYGQYYLSDEFILIDLRKFELPQKFKDARTKAFKPQIMIFRGAKEAEDFFKKTKSVYGYSSVNKCAKSGGASNEFKIDGQNSVRPGGGFYTTNGKNMPPVLTLVSKDFHFHKDDVALSISLESAFLIQKITQGEVKFVDVNFVPVFIDTCSRYYCLKISEEELAHWERVKEKAQSAKNDLGNTLDSIKQSASSFFGDSITLPSKKQAKKS